jgi:hypothetical protein
MQQEVLLSTGIRYESLFRIMDTQYVFKSTFHCRILLPSSVSIRNSYHLRLITYLTTEQRHPLCQDNGKKQDQVEGTSSKHGDKK